MTSPAAQAVDGKHLTRIGQLIPAVLYAHVMDRHLLAGAHNAGHQDAVDTQVASIAVECRDDLLDAAVVLDTLALCHRHSSCLPRPYQETSTPSPRDVSAPGSRPGITLGPTPPVSAPWPASGTQTDVRKANPPTPWCAPLAPLLSEN